jgi:hypothetical protein
VALVIVADDVQEMPEDKSCSREETVEQKNMEHQKKTAIQSAGTGEPQTDLAEGELDTVEESIRIHEQKGDLPSGDPSEKPRKNKPSSDSTRH